MQNPQEENFKTLLKDTKLELNNETTSLDRTDQHHKDVSST